MWRNSSWDIILYSF